MIAVGITLKSICPKLFHVTCVAHLLHNFAMKIKPHFEDVDQLIAKVKAVTIRNKTRQAKVSAIGYPPQPVPTRWGSWLNAALYYAHYLPEVKAIVESFVGSGILVTQAKVTLQKNGLAGQLHKIKDQYECLVKLIEKMKSAQSIPLNKQCKQFKNLSLVKTLVTSTNTLKKECKTMTFLK